MSNNYGGSGLSLVDAYDMWAEEWLASPDHITRKKRGYPPMAFDEWLQENKPWGKTEHISIKEEFLWAFEGDEAYDWSFLPFGVTEDDVTRTQIYLKAIKNFQIPQKWSEEEWLNWVNEGRPDKAPTITGLTGGAGATDSTATISENNAEVGTFTADESVSWSIGGGADEELFDIDSSTGELSFKTAPDYENPGSSDGSND